MSIHKGSGFGVRAEKFHWGQDLIQTTAGVQAVTGGSVIKAGHVGLPTVCDTGRGVLVASDKDGKETVVYYGNIIPTVRIGDTVEQGTQIGTLMPGSRLHVEVKENHVFIDPLPYLCPKEVKKPKTTRTRKTPNA